MSRMVRVTFGKAAMLFALAAVPATLALALVEQAAAQERDVSADDAVARSKKRFETDEAKCLRGDDSVEILVCSRRRSPYALPLPGERGPRDGAQTAHGEVSGARDETLSTGSCGVSFGDRCGGGVNVLAAVPLVFQLLRKIADPDAD
ncbi:MAG: hypothetical protein RIS52_2286 [Pseudomonadota bacterium]